MTTGAAGGVVTTGAKAASASAAFAAAFFAACRACNLSFAVSLVVVVLATVVVGVVVVATVVVGVVTTGARVFSLDVRTAVFVLVGLVVPVLLDAPSSIISANWGMPPGPGVPAPPKSCNNAASSGRIYASMWS